MAVGMDTVDAYADGDCIYRAKLVRTGVWLVERYTRDADVTFKINTAQPNVAVSAAISNKTWQSLP